MDPVNIPKSSTDQNNSPKARYPTTVVPSNRRAPPLGCVHSNKIGVMWTLKHEISSQNFYELLVKIELKGNTILYLKNFYNHINMCLNVVTRLLEDFLPDYQSNKRHSEFE